MSGRIGQNVELSVTARDNFANNSAILTPPQTPVSTPWKPATSNGIGHSLVSSTNKFILEEANSFRTNHGKTNSNK